MFNSSAKNQLKILKNSKNTFFLLHYSSKGQDINKIISALYFWDMNNMSKQQIICYWRKHELDILWWFFKTLCELYCNEDIQPIFITWNIDQSERYWFDVLAERYKLLTNKATITNKWRRVKIDELVNYAYQHTINIKSIITQCYKSKNPSRITYIQVFDSNQLSSSNIVLWDSECNLDPIIDKEILKSSIYAKVSNFQSIVEKLKNNTFLPPYEEKEKYTTIKGIIPTVISWLMWYFLWGNSS